MTSTSAAPRRARMAAVGMSLVLGLSLTGCTAIPVPEVVDDFTRQWGVPLDPGRKYLVDLTIGECIDLPDSGEVVAARVIDCSQEHSGEFVRHAAVPSDDGQYPADDSDVWWEVDDACIAAIDRYLGEDFMESDWDMAVLVPDQDTWDNGDRSAQCVLLHMTAKTWSGSPRTGDVKLLHMLTPEELHDLNGPDSWYDA